MNTAVEKGSTSTAEQAVENRGQELLDAKRREELTTISDVSVPDLDSINPDMDLVGLPDGTFAPRKEALANVEAGNASGAYTSGRR